MADKNESKDQSSDNGLKSEQAKNHESESSATKQSQ